jgi:hypothetical protein
LKDYKPTNNSKIAEPFLPTPLELKEGEPELSFEMLEEVVFVEEEVEIPIDLYNEIKKISDETDYSVERIVRGALEQYIDGYKKHGKLIRGESDRSLSPMNSSGASSSADIP